MVHDTVPPLSIPNHFPLTGAQGGLVGSEETPLTVLLQPKRRINRQSVDKSRVFLMLLYVFIGHPFSYNYLFLSF